MKKSQTYKYSYISSFEDFSIEKDRLIQKSKHIEERFNLSYQMINRVFSISNLLFSLVKEYVIPKISEFLGSLIKKVESKENS